MMPISEIADALEAMTRLARIQAQDAADSKTISDADINRCKALIKYWEVGEVVKPGNCRTYLDKVYRVRQGHTTQANYTPDITPAMWAIIDTEHSGTLEDPIPASRGMDYIYGKYYLDPEDNKTYLCERTGAKPGETINLQYLPHELIGNYFSLAK